jgi:hypothetical protein
MFTGRRGNRLPRVAQRLLAPTASGHQPTVAGRSQLEGKRPKRGSDFRTVPVGSHRSRRGATRTDLRTRALSRHIGRQFVYLLLGNSLKLQRIADKLGAGLGTISRTIAEKSATWQDFQKGQD